MKKIDLSGQWAFIADTEQQGVNKKYFENADWKDSMYLPGTVSEQKKVPVNNEKNTGYLTDPYACQGFMWFKKNISIADISPDYTYTLLLERTRVSHLWVNGKDAGSNNSLCGKHFYDLTETVLNSEGKEITIVLMVDNISYPTRGGHMTSPDTQTNWLGITGRLEILVEHKIHLENFRIYTQYKENTKILTVTGELKNAVNPVKAQVELKDTTDNHIQFNTAVEFTNGNNKFEFQLPENTKLWSAEEPNLYEFKLNSDYFTYNLKTGIKTFAVNKTHFEINGRKEFLRGKHDGMIFPETGYAPTDLDGWLKVMKMSKEYGINHYRFHTCCPPEAAFEAADMLGIYMEPELPFWGTIQNVGEEGFNQNEQDYLISEGFKILDNFGNHTSFVMMSMGNELWGSAERLNFILKNYHDYDCRHLYTSGSNNFQFWPQTMEYEDFFVGCRFDQKSLIRGSYAMCDAPQGFIQTEEPCSDHDYNLCFATPVTPVSDSDTAEDKEIEIQYGTGVKKVKASSISTNQHFLPGKPAVSHEVGQYCMYPDYDELKRYTGVLKPYNYEIFKERLEKAGMLNKAKDFFRDSSRLAVQCYKQEIEAIIRSNQLSGFQLLDIQDFTGQGTAVVGILNSFMESKGIVTGEQWRTFCNKTVLLSSFRKFVWKQGETLSADIFLTNYSLKDYKDAAVWVYLIDTETEEILAEECFENTNPEEGTKLLGTFSYKFDSIDEYKKYNLVLYMNESEEEESTDDIMNSYLLHVYPEADAEIVKALNFLKEDGSCTYGNILLTNDIKQAKEAAAKKQKVLLIPSEINSDLPGAATDSETNNVQTVPGTYCTDFWCYPMFRSISESMKKPVPVGTLGLTIKNKEKLFNLFKTDTYTTPKWYNIVSNATCVNLGNSEIDPAVQAIDNFERNWKLGIVWEKDGILICTARLQDLTDKAEAVLFAKSILESLDD